MKGVSIQIKISHLIIVATFVLLYQAQAGDTKGTSPAKIAATAADQHYGENRIVTGKVVQITIRPKAVFLNFEQPYPDSPFTSVVSNEFTNQFTNLASLKGRSVEVSGLITNYENKPEIILTNIGQLILIASQAGTGHRNKAPAVLPEVKPMTAAAMLAYAITLATDTQSLPWYTGCLAGCLALLILLRINSGRQEHRLRAAGKVTVAPPSKFNRPPIFPPGPETRPLDDESNNVERPSKSNRARIIPLRSAIRSPDGTKIIVQPPSKSNHVQMFSMRLPLQPPDIKKTSNTPPPANQPQVQIETQSVTQTESQSSDPGRPVAVNTTRLPEAAREAKTEVVQEPIPEAVRAGVIANLSQWLKKNLVRRLVSDRAQLLATQEAAALTVLAVDERLTKIEQKIEVRNQDYERRIDQLLKALSNAKAENREMIRAQIMFLKAEMEKERLKAREYDDEHQRY